MQKKKIRSSHFVIVLMLTVVGLLAAWVINNLPSVVKSGKPVVQPSAALTGITTPLDRNGDVDFFEALNTMGAEQVTPENNALVPISKALGPIVFGTQISPDFYLRLGIEEPALAGDYFVTIADWLNDEKKTKVHEQRYLENQFDFALSNPWSAGQLEEVKNWLSVNEQPLRRIQQGLSRPEYYQPLISNGPPRVLAALLPFAQANREIAKAFTIIGMRYLHEGRFEDCIECIRAIYQLSKNTASGHSIVEGLVGFAIEEYGYDLAIQLCRHPEVGLKELTVLQNLLDDFSFSGELERRINKSERFIGLDTLITIAREGPIPQIQSDTFGPTKIGAADMATTLRVLNQWYDELSAVTSIENDLERLNACREFESKVRRTEVEAASISSVVKAAFGSRKTKGVRTGNIYASIMLPAVGQVVQMELRGKARHHLLRLLVASVRYELANDKLPNQLSELKPDFIDNLPSDPFSGASFFYQVNNDGFQLKSSGGTFSDPYDEIKIEWKRSQDYESWEESKD